MKTEYLGITIDRTRDRTMPEQARELVKGYYLRGKEKSPQEAYARASVAYCDGDLSLAQRLYDAVSNGWFMFSSPVLSNAPAEGEQAKGLPISCFLSYVPDTLDGLIEHQSELAWLSVKGGGVGGHWSDVRAVSDKAPSPIPFIKVADSAMTAYKQGQTRKGSYAAYMAVSHPDIIEFLNIRVPTGGDPNRKCFNLNNAINITDDFMDAVVAGSDWDLVDPNDGSIRDMVPARDLWQRIIEVRFRTGEPYLNFIDEANRHLPKALKDHGLSIKGSNLCNEIHLPTDENRTAVCCLSSVNLERFDEWKASSLVSDLITMLDNILTAFTDSAPEVLKKAVHSALTERSLGLGAMGFHSYLQSKNVPFESGMATSHNRRMFKTIKEQAVMATEALAATRGEYLFGEGTGRRNSHLLAVAPNANSGIILGTSPSIEPLKSNAFTHRTRVGAHLIKNKHLEVVMEEHRLRLGKDQDWLIKEWKNIIHHEGSVQQLEYLTDWEKDVYKTAFELDQEWVVEHASQRQEFICQGQSVNLFFPAGSDKAVVNKVHLKAWKGKLKGLYYLRTSTGHTAEQVGQKVERVALQDYVDSEECMSCSG
ncbi:MAG TPA: ribonucleoside-diphosphate reductase subunit alpha [Flavobacteriales bacterium]|nr:ribonucleoside-diphosphate reductase subunit alpha [Flavobacteriales bacterium]